MAYRRRKATGRRTYRAAAPKRRRSTTRRRRATPRNQRVTVVLQMQPAGGMMPAGLTLGKKNYRPVTARY